MDKRDLALIQELMEKLQDEMEYGEDDFAERLGRKKPEVEVLKVESELPDEEDEAMEEEEPSLPMDDEDESPEEKLKKRLLKLRS